MVVCEDTDHGKEDEQGNASWRWEYSIKDHLGNPRVLFRRALNGRIGGQRHTATMEEANKTREDSTFNNVGRVRHLDMANARTGAYSAWLNAAENRLIGPSKWLAVKAQDTIQVEAFAHYKAPKKQNKLAKLSSPWSVSSQTTQPL